MTSPEQALYLGQETMRKEGIGTFPAGKGPLAAIRRKCLDCCGGHVAIVNTCEIPSCPLWPYRMGRNPFHARAGIAPAHLAKQKD